MQHISTQTETWRPVVGYTGLYEVSDHGTVRSVDRVSKHPNSGTINLKGKVLSPSSTKAGYKGVNLSKEGKIKYRRVHQLVLESFVGPRPKGMETCHNDGDPTNNHVSNLRWDTPSANGGDMVRHGRGRVSTTHCPQGHQLGMPNNKTSYEKMGRRGCLACSRARGYISNRPELKPHLKAVADAYYLRIMAGR